MNIPAFNLNSQEFKRNPHPTLANLRKNGPLVRMTLPFLGEVWVTTTYEATTDILRDKGTFVVEPRHAGRKHIAGIGWMLPPSIKALTNNMLGKDEPDHRRLRQLVDAAFMKQSIDHLRPRLAELADRQLDELQHEATRKGGQVDFLAGFARQFPLAVICELLGLPDEDRPKFARWASSFTTVTSAFALFKVVPSIWKINGYLRRQFQLCRERPRPGMISAMVQAEQEGHRLTADELLAMAFLLLLAGHETTTHLLSLGILTLLEHPEQKYRLLADWSLAESTVDEVLRWACPVQMTKPRYVARDVEMYGQSLRRGEVVTALLAAANVDPAHFPNSESFDITRSPNDHVAFGTGIHVCLGLKLARAEAAIAFERIFTRFPDVQLALPMNELQWWPRIGMRSLKALPLILGRPSSRIGDHALESRL